MDGVRLERSTNRSGNPVRPPGAAQAADALLWNHACWTCGKGAPGSTEKLSPGAGYSDPQLRLNDRPGTHGRKGDSLVFVVTLRTGWWLVERTVFMAVLAVELGVVLVQNLACNGVVKRVRLPIRVAAPAIVIERRIGDLLVASTTAFVLVEAAERPPRGGVIERERAGLSFAPVAASAVATFSNILGVAIAAILMMLAHGPDLLDVLLARFVAPGTVVSPVALRAFELETVNVFGVAKNDLGPDRGLGPGFVDFRLGLGNRGCHVPKGVLSRDNTGFLTDFLYMAGVAPRIVAPLPVTAHALTVISTLETRLLDVVALEFGRVTGPAGRMSLALRRVVVTKLATAGDGGEIRVPGMVKRDRAKAVYPLVLTSNDVQKHEVRTLLLFELRSPNLHARAYGKAKVARAWIRARVTPPTIRKRVRGVCLIRHLCLEMRLPPRQARAHHDRCHRNNGKQSGLTTFQPVVHAFLATRSG